MSSYLSRRDFLKVSGAAAASAAVLGALKDALSAQTASASDGSVVTTAADEKIVASTCHLCSAGCGILVRVANGKVVKLEGNPMHPVNTGSLCPKGQAAPELLYNPDRLTGPLKRDRATGQTTPISWDEAIQMVAAKLNELRQAGHPERAVLMHGDTRGQMRSFLTRFMQAVGSPNVISHESLNVAAAKLGVYLTQGIYALPAYDLENANYVIAFGASLLEAGPNPQRTISGYTFLRRGRATRGKVVVIDPRQSITASKADEWVPINPGTDTALALGMANVIIKSGLVDADFVKNYCFGFDNFVAGGGERKGFRDFVLENYDPQRVEQITGVPSTTIARLAGEFAGNAPAVAILPGKGGLLNGSFGGVYTAMAVHLLNTLVDSIEKPGGALTQEYMPCVEYPKLPSDSVAAKGLQTERIDGAGSKFPLGRTSYQSVADAILEGAPVEALFLYDANPVFETPGGKRFADALAKVPLVVSFSSFMDETAELADLVLPEPTFLERWGDDHIEGLGYPGISLYQPVIEPLYDTMNTGDFFIKVAEAMGGTVAKAFPWKSYEEALQFRLKDIGAEWDLLKELGVWYNPAYRFAKRGSQQWKEKVVGAHRLNAPRDGYFDLYSRELNCYLGKMKKDELARFGITLNETLVVTTEQELLEFPVMAAKLFGEFAPAFWGMNILMTAATWILIALKFPRKPRRNPLFQTATGLVMTALAVVTFILLSVGIPAIRGSLLQVGLIGAFIVFFVLALLGLTDWFQAHLVPATVIASAFVLFGMWMERWNILMPTMTHARLIPYTTYFPTVTEIAITISTFGILTLIFVVFYKFFPSITIWEVEAGRAIELKNGGNS